MQIWNINTPDANTLSFCPVLQSAFSIIEYTSWEILFFFSHLEQVFINKSDNGPFSRHRQ